MLVLTRRRDERVRLMLRPAGSAKKPVLPDPDGSIQLGAVQLVEIRGDRARVGFDMPVYIQIGETTYELSVYREEVWKTIQAEEKEAGGKRAAGEQEAAGI